MKNFIKGMLALWTVLTTLWVFVSFGILKGITEGLHEMKEESKTRRPVSYRSYYDRKS